MAKQGFEGGAHPPEREEVSRAERERLLDVCTALMAERGYHGIRVGELATLAGTSPARFHEHFADVEACVIAAYDRFAARSVQAIFVPQTTGTWTEFVDTTLQRFMDVLEADPTGARAFYVEMDAAGPAARRRRRDAVHRFAALLAQRHAEMRARDPSLAELPEAAYLGMAFAIRGLIQDALLDVHGPSFGDLARGIATFVRATVAGAAEAQRRARADE